MSQQLYEVPRFHACAKCGKQIAEFLDECLQCVITADEPQQEVKIKSCRYCHRPYATSPVGHFCSSDCAFAWNLKRYHDAKAVAAFREGWAIWAHELLQEAIKEVYPSSWILQTPGSLVDCHVGQGVLLALLDGTKPASRAKGQANPPKRDNVVAALSWREGTSDQLEDQIEREWDALDRRN